MKRHYIKACESGFFVLRFNCHCNHKQLIWLLCVFVQAVQAIRSKWRVNNAHETCEERTEEGQGVQFGALQPRTEYEIEEILPELFHCMKQPSWLETHIHNGIKCYVSPIFNIPNVLHSLLALYDHKNHLKSLSSTAAHTDKYSDLLMIAMNQKWMEMIGRDTWAPLISLPFTCSRLRACNRRLNSHTMDKICRNQHVMVFWLHLTPLAYQKCISFAHMRETHAESVLIEFIVLLIHQYISR